MCFLLMMDPLTLSTCIQLVCLSPSDKNWNNHLKASPLHQAYPLPTQINRHKNRLQFSLVSRLVFSTLPSLLILTLFIIEQSLYPVCQFNHISSLLVILLTLLLIQTAGSAVTRESVVGLQRRDSERDFDWLGGKYRRWKQCENGI